MRTSRPGAWAMAGIVGTVLAGSLSGCGSSQHETSYADFCTGYVKLLQSEMGKPLSVPKMQAQAKAMRDTGVPSDMSGSATTGLNELLGSIDKLPTSATAVPRQGSDKASYDFGAYLDAHCGEQLKTLLPPDVQAKIKGGQSQSPLLGSGG